MKIKYIIIITLQLTKGKILRMSHELYHNMSITQTSD